MNLTVTQTIKRLKVQVETRLRATQVVYAQLMMTSVIVERRVGDELIGLMMSSSSTSQKYWMV